MSVYKRVFNETEYMSLIKYDELFEKNNEIWKKLRIASKMNFIVNLYITKNI